MLAALAILGVVLQLDLAPLASSSSTRPTSRTRSMLRDAPKVQVPQAPSTFASPSDLEPAPLERQRVCVQDHRQQPLAGLALNFYCSNTSARLVGPPLRTDEEGCLELSPCPGRDILTCVRPVDPALRRESAWVLDPEQAQTQLRLAEPAKVWGRVADARGELLAGAKMWFEAQDPDPMSAPPFVQMRLSSDKEGAFAWVPALPAPCDPCVLDEEDCELSRRQDLARAPAEGTIWIRHSDHPLFSIPMPMMWGEMPELRLSRGPHRLEGRLQAEKTASVKLLLEHARHRLDRQQTSADAQGNFEFRGLGSGPYTLSVFQEGRRVLRKEGLMAGQRVSLSW